MPEVVLTNTLGRSHHISLMGSWDVPAKPESGLGYLVRGVTEFFKEWRLVRGTPQLMRRHVSCFVLFHMEVFI